jgi:hypothetical protein
MKPMERVYPDGHPARGVQLAAVGKLLLVVEPRQEEGGGTSTRTRATGRLLEARQVLSRALAELELGFGGQGGQVGREVSAMVQDAERERAMRGHAAKFGIE